jgi:sigma54-dependent transcription regulator
MESRRQRISSPSNNTCLWMLEREEYEDRHGGRHSFLWLKGKAGAGKSVLTKYIYDINRSAMKESGRYISAYFFDSGGTVLERSLLGLLRSVIYQLVS